MSHYLQNEYFRDEEPDGEEYVVERAPFRPKEDVVDVVNRMLYRFLFLGVLLMGIILTFTYKERIFNPPPGPDAIAGIQIDDAEEKAKLREAQQKLKITLEQNDVMKLVNARHLDPNFPLNDYNRGLIIKHWPHVIQGADSQSVQMTLDILDMRYDEHGNPRNLTPEEIAVLDKKYGKNRKFRHKLSAIMMAELEAEEEVLPEAVAVEEAVAAEGEALKPEVAEKAPEESPKKAVKRKKKERDPLHAEVMDFVMGQTQQMVDSVLNPVSVEPEEDEYEEYEEEVEEVKEPVRLTPPKTVVEKVPEVYDVDALDAALGMKNGAEEAVEDDPPQE